MVMMEWSAATRYTATPVLCDLAVVASYNRVAACFVVGNVPRKLVWLP